MSDAKPVVVTSDAAATGVRRLAMLMPGAAALAYPFLLKGFHLAVPRPDEASSTLAIIVAAAFFLGAIAVPILGLGIAGRLSRTESPTLFQLRARRLAYFSVGAPPMFVFAGVAIGLLDLPFSDISVWVPAWLAAIAHAWMGSTRPAMQPMRPDARLRVFHGVSAALITVFVLFHLTNHLFGWFGPERHAAVMELGRAIYRVPVVETLLVALLLFQVGSGARLAWQWSAHSASAYRVFQIGSGLYLAAFILAHLNSALVSARLVRGTETDWAWASGGSAGLVYDAWNIRLLPHYAFGVFFVLGHLASGLRQVLLAHGLAQPKANKAWALGLIASGIASTTIIAALCGARV